MIGEMTKVIVRFGPAGAPVSARTGGHNYVWHCHILEHEEHDIMRPLIVMP
jgi:spore coat protein A